MNYSKITDDLLIGTTPGARDYKILHNLGVRLVINMRIHPRHHSVDDDPKVNYLWLPTFDNPLLPIPVRALIRGANAALDEIGRGGKIYTYCARGRHRSVAMGAAILIAQGLPPEAAIGLIQKGRPVADPNAFYIRRRISLFGCLWSSPQKHQHQNIR